MNLPIRDGSPSISYQSYLSFAHSDQHVYRTTFSQSPAATNFQHATLQSMVFTEQYQRATLRPCIHIFRRVAQLPDYDIEPLVLSSKQSKIRPTYHLLSPWYDSHKRHMNSMFACQAMGSRGLDAGTKEGNRRMSYHYVSPSIGFGYSNCYKQI